MKTIFKELHTGHKCVCVLGGGGGGETGKLCKHYISIDIYMQTVFKYCSLSIGCIRSYGSLSYSINNRVQQGKSYDRDLKNSGINWLCIL